MDSSDILSLVAIVMSSVFSILTIVVGTLMQRDRTRLDKIELIVTQKADILIFFSSENRVVYDMNMISARAGLPIPQNETNRRLVIKNVGQREATNIEISLRDNDGNELNHGRGLRFKKEIKTIKILAPGLEVTFPYDLLPNASIEGITGYWSWKNPDGSVDSRESSLDFYGNI